MVRVRRPATAATGKETMGQNGFLMWPLFKNFNACPTCDPVWASLVLVTVDVEAISELGRSPVFADVRLPVDLDHRPELEHGRIRDDITTATDVRA